MFGIKEISVKGCRKFQEPFKLDLVSPLGRPLERLIIAGDNGCGKTSIVEAMVLGLHRSRQQGLSENYTGAEIDLTFVDEHNKYQIIRSIGTRPALDRVELIHNGVSVYIGSGNSGELYDDCRIPEINMSVAYFPAIRPQSLPNFAVDSDWLRKLNAVWDRFNYYDGSYLDWVQSGACHYLGVFKRKKLIYYADQGGAGWIDLISIFGRVIAKKYDIIIIDNPELHLHPQSQAAYYRALREISPYSQIILATNSDALWDQAMSFERVFLANNPNDPRATTTRRETP